MNPEQNEYALAIHNGEHDWFHVEVGDGTKFSLRGPILLVTQRGARAGDIEKLIRRRQYQSRPEAEILGALTFWCGSGKDEFPIGEEGAAHG